jgi:hypothetical protein
MALARVILDLQAVRNVRVENFASYLARHSAVDDVEIVAPSAWSCAHGVERWRSNCSCRRRSGTNQAWRTPLRDAIASLADGIHEVYERESSRFFDDPWAARDAYGEVVATPERIEAWVNALGTRHSVLGTRHSSSFDSQFPIPDSPPVPSADYRVPMSLLEMERGALRIFTSCAWFFDDIGGLEPVEVLRYAARAIELAGPHGPALEAAFLARLADAKSNDPSIGTGRDVYLTMAKPRIGQLARLAASVGAARAVSPDDPRSRSASVTLAVDVAGETVSIRQRRTGEQVTFAVTVHGLPAPNADHGNGTWSPAMISARIADPPVDVALQEMTERQRSVVEDGIRHRLIAAAFGDDPPALDATTSADILSPAIVGATSELSKNPDERLTSRLYALLDLAEIERLHIPFDAQTRFYETFIAQDRASQMTHETAALAWRLGFANPDELREAAATPSVYRCLHARQSNSSRRLHRVHVRGLRTRDARESACLRSPGLHRGDVHRTA